MPKEIEQLAAQYLNNPVKVKIGRVSVPTANVAQTLERATEGQKLELLVDLLQVRLSRRACETHYRSGVAQLNRMHNKCMSNFSDSGLVLFTSAQAAL